MNLLSLEELGFIGVGQDHVLGDELVVRDVHQKLLLHEHFKVVGGVRLQRLQHRHRKDD